MGGALAGLKVIEMAGIGPAPFAAMLLADHGAEVLRIERPGAPSQLGLDPRHDPTMRSRRSLALDLRAADGREAVMALIGRADALIEGFRPGVMERLGLGPDTCLERNPGLVYGRMTGWGQHGPLAMTAGHDINYLALSGALAAIGPEGEAPVPPLNLVADYGGGAMMLAFGILAAVFEARRSGRGQVVDAAMTDGVALLTSLFHGLRAAGQWRDGRGRNLIDGGAPFYGCYLCADGRAIAVGPLEPQFHAEFLRRLGMADPDFTAQLDEARWPRLKAKLAALFLTRPRDEWCALFEGSDACVTPVLDWDEAPVHPHNVARRTFIDVGGFVQPAPAPRFGRTPAGAPEPPAVADLRSVLADWGIAG